MSLALTLIHFLWEGAALAALASIAWAFCRSASARYAVGVGALALMLAALIGTFLFLRAEDGIEPPVLSTYAATPSVSLPPGLRDSLKLSASPARVPPGMACGWSKPGSRASSP